MHYKTNILCGLVVNICYRHDRQLNLNTIKLQINNFKNIVKLGFTDLLCSLN